eukprot:EG_transcript_51458
MTPDQTEAIPSASFGVAPADLQYCVSVLRRRKCAGRGLNPLSVAIVSRSAGPQSEAPSTEVWPCEAVQTASLRDSLLAESVAPGKLRRRNCPRAWLAFRSQERF